MQLALARAGETGSAAAETLKGMDLFIVDIGQGEVGHVEMIGPPAGSTGSFFDSWPETKKGELVTETALLAGIDIAGEIPPLGAIFIMGTMVGGKLELPGPVHLSKRAGGVAAQDVGDRYRLVAVFRVSFNAAGKYQDCEDDPGERGQI